MVPAQSRRSHRPFHCTQARLQKEKESLENKLADFDLVMGDAAKKSK